jgi:serine/threonine-protein kinase RsbW
LRIEIAPAKVTVLVRDEGGGFEPERIPDPTQPDNLLNSSGRGILMMKAFMDEVDFSPSESGLLVKMIKNYSP